MLYIPNTGFENKPVNSVDDLAAEVSRFRLNSDFNGYSVMQLRTGDKACKVRNWQNGAAKPHDLARPRQGLYNTGILCAGLRIVDNDIDSPALARALEDVAVRVLGSAPCRYRANSSRIALLYRAAQGSPGKRVIESRLLVNDDGKPSRVEVLGNGQFLLADGLHPSGARLQWEGGSPADTPVSELPVATEAQIEGFLGEAARLIGGTTPLGGLAKTRTAPMPNPFGLNGGMSPGGPVSIARLENLLDQIGSHPSRPFAVYDTWVKVCCLPITGMIQRSQINHDDGMALMKRISERHG